ncbi:MAG: toll/interleukin-1 receptor domain-containing protein [Anaerolineae bacterium]|nr:toll/interleukin-1 receptor domain-containing protein [Anaerolineae bacterium]
MRQVFMNYVPGDESFATQLTHDLRGWGAGVWLDIDSAEPGRFWSRSIERALAESHMMIVILSPDALDAPHVIAGWQAYLDAHRPVIPVLAALCAFPDRLNTRRPVDFTRDYRQAFHRLTTRLIEQSTRLGRLDPVIWTISDDVSRFREAQAPPPEPDPADDANQRTIRSMVLALRDLLRRRVV